MALHLMMEFYILLKEIIDNSVDEFVMGASKTIEITLKDNIIKVRTMAEVFRLVKWLMLFRE